jgi:hypothetical protein
MRVNFSNFIVYDNLKSNISYSLRRLEVNFGYNQLVFIYLFIYLRAELNNQVPVTKSSLLSYTPINPIAYVRIKNTYIILKKEPMGESCCTPEENIGSGLGNFCIMRTETHPSDITYRTTFSFVANVSNYLV